MATNSLSLSLSLYTLASARSVQVLRRRLARDVMAHFSRADVDASGGLSYKEWCVYKVCVE